MNNKIYKYDENPFGISFEVFYPDTYEELSLIVYLHGAGERGTDITHLSRHGIPKLIEEGKEIPAVVLCPQCPTWCVWDNIVSTVKEVIDWTMKEYSIKKDRVCITGSSMGGFGTWMMGMTYNNFFAGMAPVAGGNMSWRASNLQSTPILAFHGDADEVVPIVYSELMVEGVCKSGGSAELVSLDGYGHNDGIDFAYRNTNLIEWLLEQRRKEYKPVPEFCSEWF